MFNNNTIRARVIFIVNEKIDNAQIEHEKECEKIEAEAKNKKEVHLELMVNTIIAKIIN